mgnify:CR=1 FL=1
MTDSVSALPGHLWNRACTMWRVVPTPVGLTIAVLTVAVGQFVAPRLGLAEPTATVVRFVGAVALFFALLWATYAVAAREV